MKLLVQKTTFFWVFSLTVWFINVQALIQLSKKHNCLLDDYSESYLLVPKNVSALKLSMSKKWPKQIVLYNEKTKVAIVIDATTERIAFEALSTPKIVIDVVNCKVYEFTNTPISKLNEFEDYLRNYNITYQLDRAPYKRCHGNCEIIKDLVQGFFKSLPSFVKAVGGVFWKSIDVVLRPIMDILKSFGDILHMEPESAWSTFTLGISALFNIIKYAGVLLNHAVGSGSISKFVDARVKIPLHLVTGASSGLEAFNRILISLAKMNLMDILKNVLSIPERLCRLIFGLGGLVLRGVNGVFGIIYNLMKFIKTGLTNAVAPLTNMVLSFLKRGQPSRDDFKKHCDELLTTATQQKEKYKLGEDFKEYEGFFSALNGIGSYNMSGIPIEKVVSILIKKGQTSKQVVYELIKAVTSVASMRSLLPDLLIHLVESLNTENGPSYVQKLYPSINLTDYNALQANYRNFKGNLGKNDVTPSLYVVKTTPVVKDIYKEIDEAARTYTNKSLDALLSEEHVKKLLKITPVIEKK